MNQDLVETDQYRLRTVRSFVRREGRITDAQERALADHWPAYGVDDFQRLTDLDALFGRRAPRVLEIGYGTGDNLAAMARAYPATDFLGAEVYRPGVGKALATLVAQRSANVRLVMRDAVELMATLPDASLDAVYVLFPDPWPKLRHHKRRLVSAVFADDIVRVLKRGGRWYLATDDENYAHHMAEICSNEPRLSNLTPAAMWSLRPHIRPLTRFESRGLRAGHVVRDLCFVNLG
ncbi:MAG: tRNA (guanosine(46)-N7)-methyltransferase TrmB [Gammaproteobacteria bacterium]|nr:tRNA (guanosine(46)-N7)-methyltransferase TrmB [Gammaproteobacteria bacterium]